MEQPVLRQIGAVAGLVMGRQIAEVGATDHAQPAGGFGAAASLDLKLTNDVG